MAYNLFLSVLCMCYVYLNIQIIQICIKYIIFDIIFKL